MVASVERNSEEVVKTERCTVIVLIFVVAERCVIRETVG